MADEKLNKLLLRLRALDPSLARARFSLVEVYEDARAVRVTMICDNAVSSDLRAKMLGVLNEELPQSFRKIALDVKKTVADEELVKKEIISKLKTDYISIAYNVADSDVEVQIPPKSQKNGEESARDAVRFSIKADAAAEESFIARGVIREIEKRLSRCFCEDFRGELVTVEKPVDFSVLERKLPQVEKIVYRSIEVEDMIKVDDLLESNVAVYIDDLRGEMDSVCLCGEILSVRERATVNGKPYYLIEFSDRSGKITGTYFNKKTTEDKIRKLKEGDGIIVQGSIEKYRDRMSLVIRRLNLCRFPKDFVPEKKPSRPAPLYYTEVSPERITEYTQKDIFTPETPAPDCLMGETFVVFDFETTGTDVTSDCVTEIGAVKIVDGVIREKFTTLINPQMKIREETVRLNGIDDELVKDKPPFSKVSGDIYKFFEGATLVAHNAEFDLKFLKRQSGEQGYIYDNHVIDTLQFARDTLKNLHNHKLNTLADYFDLKFNHHRAFDDAYATALIFIELVKKTGKLPKFMV